jgi:segregation and condensation protein B
MPNIPPVPLAPPIGWVMEVEKGITSLDLVVPVEAAQAISTFAIQAAQQVAPPADNEEMEDEEMDEDDDEEDEEGEEDEEENEEEEEAGEEEK